jgi:DNA-binding GntR family transcriptional regulator
VAPSRERRSSALSSLRRARLVDEVAAALREAISRGELKPGERLLQERLAEQLAVSRTPLREALHRLEQEGLVVLSRGRGVEVRRLDDAQVIELYEVREMLDGLAARLAAQRSTPAERRAIERVLREMERAVARWDPHTWLLCNLRFHEQVLAAAHNQTLAESLRLVRLSAQAFYPTVLLNRERAQVALAEHRRILAAIERRDPEAAEREGRLHIVTARQMVEARLAAQTAAPAEAGDTRTA